jgi:dolichol kinase
MIYFLISSVSLNSRRERLRVLHLLSLSQLLVYVLCRKVKIFRSHFIIVFYYCLEARQSNVGKVGVS